jgi:hypothetical protein
MIFNLDYVQSLIDNKAEESLYLEFKRPDALDFDNIKLRDKKKFEFGKDVSSFAKSDGGIIIYGIAEHNHVANELLYVDGNKITIERLTQILNTQVNKKLDCYKIHAIRVNEDFEQTIYIIQVDKSQSLPHMAGDNKYHKRVGSTTREYQEYEVRRDYLTLRQTNLESMIPKVENFYHNFSSHRIQFWIKNKGEVLEKEYKLIISCPKKLIFNDNEGIRYKVKDIEENRVFAFNCEQTIFPGETLELGSLLVNTTKEFHDFNINAKLYFSSGSRTQNFKLLESLKT